MSGSYNYGSYYNQQQQQQQGHSSGYRSYAQCTPVTTASGAYSTHPASSDRYQQSQTPSYGVYKRPAYESRTTSGGLNAPSQQYHTYQTGTQQSHYQQSQGSSSTQQSRPHGNSLAQYYGQQQARSNSDASAPARYQTPEQAQQQRASPAYRQSTSDQYSNVRAEAAPQSNTYHSGHSNVTVDPSQIYDNSHDIRRQAKLAEAEAAKWAKEQEERRKAEKAQRLEAERREQEAAEQAREQRRAAAEQRRLAEEAAKAQSQDATKTKKPRKLRDSTGTSEGKNKGNAARGSDMSQMQEAAMMLVQTANANGGDQGSLEAQMKDMFKKMREFNSMDPEMLSRLWQEERDQHLATQQAPAAEQAAQSTAAASGATTTTPKAKKKQQPLTEKHAETGSAKKSSKSTKASVTQPSTIAKPSAASSSKKPTSQAAAPAGSTQATPAAAKATASAPRSKRASLWPADKKAALSNAASELLKTMPGNNGKTLPPTGIASLLDENPNYPELCKQIEARGVKVERSSFADALLKAIPNIGKARSSKKGTKSVGTNESPASPSQISHQTLADAQKRLMEGAALIKVPKKANKASDATQFRPTEPQSSAATTDAPQAKMANGSVHPSLGGLEAVQMYVDGEWVNQAAPSPSMGKSKGGRKPSKAKGGKPPEPTGPPTKYDLARKRDFSELIDLSQRLSDDEGDVDVWTPPAKRHEVEAPSTQNQPGNLPTPPDTTAGGRSPPVGAQPSAGLSFAQNPPEISLDQPNQQLSFNPTQTAAPPPVPKAPVSSAPPLPRNHPSRITVMIRDLDKCKALRRSQYDPRTIARDVLIASGRHPDMRPLNAHLEAFRALPFNVDTMHDLSTFRWDMIDPGGAAPGSGAPVLARPQVAPLDVDADDEDSDNDSVLGRPAAIRQTVDVGGSVVNGAGDIPGMMPAPKKKGGPRKSEPIFRTYGDSAPQQPKRPRHSEGVPSSSKGTGTGVYAQLKQQQANVDPEAPKKRGRPVGWRKYMMADPSSYKGASENRVPGSKPGRKKKSPSPPREYPVFKCEWKGCAVELHNLATLRRHLHKLYGKADSDGNFVCAWKDCFRITSAIDEPTGRASSEIKSHKFRSLDDWKKHVEDKHITPIAWKLGDGPKDGLSDNYESEVSEAMMSDREGRRITPKVLPPDDTQPNRQKSKAEQEAERTRAQAEQRAWDIGPAVDRGGATLATEERRKAFRDDDVAMVVDEDD